MTCFMVAYHTRGVDSSIAVSPFDAGLNDYLSGFFNAMGGIVMSYFFTVTGFLLFNHLTFETYGRKIRKRVSSLLMPYVLWQMIVTVKSVVQGRYDLSLVTFLKLTFGFVAWPADGAMWYVYAVFIMALLSPLLLILFRNKRKAFVSVIVIFVLLHARWIIFTNPYFVAIMSWGYIDNVLYYLPAFLIGAFYGKFHDEISPEYSTIYVTLLLFVSFCTEGAWGPLMNSTLILMFPILLLIGLPTAPSLVDRKIYKLTFLMYAVHQPLLDDHVKEYAYNFLTFLHMPASLDNILIRLMVIAIDIFISLLIYSVLSKICPQLLKLLCGGRTDNKVKTSA